MSNVKCLTNNTKIFNFDQWEIVKYSIWKYMGPHKKVLCPTSGSPKIMMIGALLLDLNEFCRNWSMQWPRRIGNRVIFFFRKRFWSFVNPYRNKPYSKYYSNYSGHGGFVTVSSKYIVPYAKMNFSLYQSVYKPFS